MRVSAVCSTKIGDEVRVRHQGLRICWQVESSQWQRLLNQERARKAVGIVS